MNKVNEETRLHFKLTYLYGRFLSGIKKICANPLALAAAVVYWCLALALVGTLPSDSILDALMYPVLCVCVIVCAACIFTTGVTVSAIPRDTLQFATAFRSIRLINSAGNAPLMTDRKRLKGGIVNIELFSPGVPLQTYKDRQEEIESAINRRITRIDEGHDKQHITLRLAPGDSKLPDLVYLPTDPHTKAAEILLGVSLDGPVIVNLDRTPHLLIGGSTGSGKTQLMISAIAQLTAKRTEANHPLVDVYLVDLKGGQDYPPRWRGQDCSFCENAGDALSILSMVVGELESRKIRFAAAGVAHGTSCSSLDKYNHLSPDAPLRRIVVAVDEIAELTDTSGATKPEKEQIAAIVGKLATIARLGRAFGINLLIGTQRPDANAVPGQIKNNLDYRVCGKADNTLSIIILDNSDAADLIPKDSQGLFLNHEGVLFRGYLYHNT